jgi:hypothetical protein
MREERFGACCVSIRNAKAQIYSCGILTETLHYRLELQSIHAAAVLVNKVLYVECRLHRAATGSRRLLVPEMATSCVDVLV